MADPKGLMLKAEMRWRTLPMLFVSPEASSGWPEGPSSFIRQGLKFIQNFKGFPAMSEGWMA
ncbi:hypothetical protein J6590_051167 [Homalodisca vitripennis]|nr:hypothetical protein J6590_051167 [Homalodisca vitripennis]